MPKTQSPKKEQKPIDVNRKEVVLSSGTRFTLKTEEVKVS